MEQLSTWPKRKFLGNPTYKGQWFGKLLQLHHLDLYSSEMQHELSRLPACYLLITPWKRLPVYARGCGDRTLFPLLHCHTKASCGSRTVSRELHNCHPADMSQRKPFDIGWQGSALWPILARTRLLAQQSFCCSVSTPEASGIEKCLQFANIRLTSHTTCCMTGS